jgi:hypothetical protein
MTVDLNSYDNSNIRFCRTRRLFFENICEDKEIERYQVYYENRKGVLDWIVMDCTSNKTITTKDNTYSKNYRTYDLSQNKIIGDLSTISKNRFNITSTEIFDLQTDYFENDDDYLVLEELITSPKIFMYDPKSNLIYSMLIKDTNFKIKKKKTDDMYQFKLKLEKQIQNVR